MPYNSETSEYERRSTTVIDATPDGDTVAVAIDTKLDLAADDAVIDLNHHMTNGRHYPVAGVTDGSQFLKKSPAGVVSWTNGIPFEDGVDETELAAPTGSAMIGYGAGTVKDRLDAISASGGSSLVGFSQDGTGASARTVQAKLRDVVSVKDFGAVGDGVTDDTAAIQAALNVGGDIYITGMHKISSHLEIKSNTRLIGVGLSGFVVSELDFGGSGVGGGHRIIDARGITNYEIVGLKFDTSAMSSFSGGLRCIFNYNSSNFLIKENEFISQGAATSCLDCSNYTITGNKFNVSGPTSMHDGIYDSWDGSHDFKISRNTASGAGVAKYGILVTGTNTDGLSAPCYNFEIDSNIIIGCKQIGIMTNGRIGKNYNFIIRDNKISSVSLFHGIAVADSYSGVVSGNIIKETAFNGIRLYSETLEGGVLGAEDVIVSENIVCDSNELGSTSDDDGSAILVSDGSKGCTILGNNVTGTKHRFGVRFASTVSNCLESKNNIIRGTQGRVQNSSTTSRVDSAQYSGTGTAVTNVTNISLLNGNYTISGDVVTVAFSVSITPTTGPGTTTQARLSLPIPSDVQFEPGDVHGVAASKFGLVAAVFGDTTNNEAIIQFQSTNTVANTLYGTFTYRIR